jgi:Tol biopolymer transport system component
MKRISTLLLAIIATGHLAAQSKSPESMLGAALHQEEVQRDIKGAIASYKKLLGVRGLNRKVTAEALFHLGLCYEKLGDAEARKAFDRLVNEYGDTLWAAQARPRMVALESGRRMDRQTATLLWKSDIDCEGTISPDGRYVSYTDWKTGNMAFQDLVKGTDFPVTKTGTWKDGAAEFAETAAFSRDGKQLAYQWFEHKTGRFELRVTGLTGDAAPRSLFHSEEFRWVAPHDWSPDGKWIAAGLEPENSDARTFEGIKPGQKAAIALVGVQDGSLRLLKTTEWLSQDSGFGNIRFSPDGKLLAYDRPPTDPRRWWQRHVFVLVVEEGREIPIAVNSSQEQLVGWSPDGSHLLFTSDRTGSIDLWSVAFANGKPEGNAEMIRQGIGWIVPFKLNAAGGLYYCVAGARDLPIAKTATFDFSIGKLLSPPADVTQADHGEGSLSPDWSPDGKSLAFISRRRTGSGYVASIKIQSTESGEVREIHPMLYAPSALRYAPDGRSLLILQSGPMVRVDAQTGDVSPVLKQEPGVRRDRPSLSLDGKTLYYARQERATSADTFVIARALASGSESELMRRGNLGGLLLSPDGRHLATLSQDPTQHSSTFLIIPLQGGDTREVALPMDSPAKVSMPFSMFAWTPDSKSFLLRKHLAADHVELWRVSIAGGSPQRINERLDLPLTTGGVRVHPDGRRILLFPPVQGPLRSQSQIMLLENFLPSRKAEKTAAR